MALLDQIAARQASAQTSARTTRTAAQDRPQAKVWMNVGYKIGDKFVNLPLGLAIDTMEPVEARGQNEDWIMLQSARNELLKAIQEAGDELKPGEERELPLTVVIRHVADPKTIDKENNPLSMENAGFSLSIVK